MYIEQGRFGEFVSNFLKLEQSRRKEEAEKEDNRMLWDLYIRSMPDMSFSDWKESITRKSQQQPKTYKMTDEQVAETINNSRKILKGFNMKK